MNDADWRICAADRERLDRHVTLRRLIFFAALFLLFVFVCFVCFFSFSRGRPRSISEGLVCTEFFLPSFFCVCVCVRASQPSLEKRKRCGGGRDDRSITPRHPEGGRRRRDAIGVVVVFVVDFRRAPWIPLCFWGRIWFDGPAFSIIEIRVVWAGPFFSLHRPVDQIDRPLGGCRVWLTFLLVSIK